MNDLILEALDIGLSAAKAEAASYREMMNNYFIKEVHEILDENVRKIEAAIALYKSEACWVTWGGGECPTNGEMRVDIRLRSGYEFQDRAAGDLRWSHVIEGDFNIGDIIAYRISESKS